MRCERILGGGRALHELQDARAGVLKRNIEVGQDAARGHEVDHAVDVRIGIHIVQPDPDAEFGECPGEVVEARALATRRATPGGIFQIRAIGAGVLGNHQDLLHPGTHQLLGLAQHLADRAAAEAPAHGRDDAEGAVMVAALGNLEIGVMPGSELHPLRGHEIHERLMPGRQMFMHRGKHVLVTLRAGDFQDRRMAVQNALRLRTEAAGDDHPAVLRQRLADGVQGFVHRRIDESAGIHDDQVRGGITGRHFIALGAQARENPLRVHQGLGTPQTDEAHLGDFAAGVFQEARVVAKRARIVLQNGGPLTVVKCRCQTSSAGIVTRDNTGRLAGVQPPLKNRNAFPINLLNANHGHRSSGMTSDANRPGTGRCNNFRSFHHGIDPTNQH